MGGWRGSGTFGLGDLTVAMQGLEPIIVLGAAGSAAVSREPQLEGHQEARQHCL